MQVYDPVAFTDMYKILNGSFVREFELGRQKARLFLSLVKE